MSHNNQNLIAETEWALLDLGICGEQKGGKNKYRHPILKCMRICVWESKKKKRSGHWF